MNVMESKNVPMPENRQTNTAGYANHQPVATSNYQAPRYQAPAATGGVNWGKAVLGMVICLIGLGLTLSSDGAIFYGAILVGFFMMIGGFIGD